MLISSHELVETSQAEPYVLLLHARYLKAVEEDNDRVRRPAIPAIAAATASRQRDEDLEGHIRALGCASVCRVAVVCGQASAVSFAAGFEALSVAAAAAAADAELGHIRRRCLARAWPVIGPRPGLIEVATLNKSSRRRRSLRSRRTRLSSRCGVRRANSSASKTLMGEPKAGQSLLRRHPDPFCTENASTTAAEMPAAYPRSIWELLACTVQVAPPRFARATNLSG